MDTSSTTSPPAVLDHRISPPLLVEANPVVNGITLTGSAG